MTSKKGSGLLMVWWDVPDDKEAEFNRCYNEQFAALLSVPGFLNAARYQATTMGEPKHLAMYELEDAAAAQSAAVEKLLNETDPHQEATTLIRNVYTLIHPSAVTPQIAHSEMAPAMRVGRMDVGPDIDDEWNHFYNTVHVPTYEKAVGVIRGRRFRAVVGEPRYLTIYELENAGVCDTESWKAHRNVDAMTESFREKVRPAKGSPGIYAKTSK